RHTRSKRDWSSDVCSSDLLEEDAVRELGLLLDPPDHHQLDVEELIHICPDLVGDRANDVGKLLLDPFVHGLADAWRKVAPKLREIGRASCREREEIEVADG